MENLGAITIITIDMLVLALLFLCIILFANAFLIHKKANKEMEVIKKITKDLGDILPSFLEIFPEKLRDTEEFSEIIKTRREFYLNKDFRYFFKKEKGFKEALDKFHKLLDESPKIHSNLEFRKSWKKINRDILIAISHSKRFNMLVEKEKKIRKNVLFNFILRFLIFEKLEKI